MCRLKISPLVPETQGVLDRSITGSGNDDENAPTPSPDELFAELNSGRNGTILGEIPRTSLENFKSLSAHQNFKTKVYWVVRDLEALGWEPLVRNGWRTQAQANLNAAVGSGVKNSLHLSGLAADIVDASADSPEKYGSVKRKFWEDLRDCAHKYDLRSGMDFRKVDPPHIDAGRSHAPAQIVSGSEAPDRSPSTDVATQNTSMSSAR